MKTLTAVVVGLAIALSTQVAGASLGNVVESVIGMSAQVVRANGGFA